MADEEMFDDDAASSSSEGGGGGGYYSYGGSKWGIYSPPPTPAKPVPIMEYQLRFEEAGMGMGGRGKCM